LSGNLESEMATTNATAKDATRLAAEAERQAIALEDQMRRAPDTNINLNRELAEVTNICKYTVE